ncbi:MAG: HypC/HybG/HupF family hydrogenase formation chaperone [Candidatus Bathyarchaeota archaeon]
MCLAIPAKVLEKKDNRAKVDFGSGVIREINISLVDANVEDFVIVHAGFAIQVLDKERAEETLEILREMLSLQEENLS